MTLRKIACIFAGACYNDEQRQVNTMSSGRGEIPHWRYSPRPTGGHLWLTR